MTEGAEMAVELARDLREDDVAVITRPTLYGRVRDEAELDALDHAAIESALAEEDWVYGRHVYFHAEGLADRLEGITETYREEGRLLVTHREVCDRIAGGEDRGGVEGWQQGPFVERVIEAFTEHGWLTDTIDGADARAYVYPLLDAIRDEHPRGRFWRSPEELFGYYLATSVTAAIEREE